MVEFDYLRQVSHSTSMLDVLDYYNIDYHNAGASRFKCVCPFHDDHTPSLIVYTSNDHSDESYCCYVDNNAGDAFHFIRNMEHGDFNQAWSVLCHINGIKDVDALKIDQLDLLFKGNKDQEDKRPTNSINHQISTMYRDLYRQKSSNLAEDRLKELAATIDSRFHELDKFLSNNPPFNYVHNYYKEELQHIKRIGKAF